MVSRLRRRGQWTPSARASGKMIRVAFASLGMGLAVALASHYRHVLQAPLDGFALGPLGAKEITVLLVCLAGAAVYPALLFAFGGVTPAEAAAAFRRRKGDKPEPGDLP
jgi:putative peptidoglycan lipid II flippase